jgi:uncharacterized protein (TIGR03083 family)
MDPTAHIAALRNDSTALLAAHDADPSAPVPSCPGWDRAALLAHTGMAQHWHLAQLDAGPAERVRYSTVAKAPEGDAVRDWYTTGVATLIAALERLDAATTWATWAGPQPSAFFPRRMAHETAVHRWDADHEPIGRALAIDGVDELFDVFVPLIPVERLAGAAGTIHLHATDDGDGGEGEWLITLGPEGIRSEHGHAKGDVAVRGAASDLLLWAWNRVPVDDRFEVFGDASLLDAWRVAVVI